MTLSNGSERLLDDIDRIDRRLHELMQNPSPEDGPFDFDDVEYFRLVARKARLGCITMASPDWLERIAVKLEATLRQ